MSPLCQVLALFLFLCHAESSTCSLLHAVPSSVYKQLQFFFFSLKVVHCWAHCKARALDKLSCSQFCSDSLTQSSSLEQMCWSILGCSLRHFKNFKAERTGHYSFTFVPNSLCKVVLMSVWGGPQACELVSQPCSTRASACPSLALVRLCMMEGSDASGHIRVR